MCTADQCAMAAALTQFFLHLVKHTISLLLQSQSAAFGSYCEASGGSPMARFARHKFISLTFSKTLALVASLEKVKYSTWSRKTFKKRCVLILDQAYVQTRLLLH